MPHDNAVLRATLHMPQICPFTLHMPQICPFTFHMPQICPFTLHMPQICPFTLHMPQICPFKFNDMRRDGDHRLTKGDVLGAVGPLMHTAQAGIVFMGSQQSDPRNAASIWEDFRDSMRELATDQVAAAIATGAFDEVDAARTGKIQGVPPFLLLHQCFA